MKRTTNDESEQIGNLISLEYGSGLTESKRKGGKYPVFGSNGIVGYHNEYQVQGPGIVVGRKGSIGEVNWTNEDFWPIDTTYYVKLKDKNTSLKYVYYLLSQKNLKDLNSATGIPGLNRNDVYNVSCFFPAHLEQQKIVSILSKVDELIQKTDQVIEQTQRLKKGLMQKLLTKGIGHTKFRNVEFGSKFLNYGIPMNWIVDTIKNVSSKLVVGFVGVCDPFYTDNDDIPMIRTTNVKEGYLDLTNIKYVTREFHEKNKKSQLKNNDLIVARHGENGQACLVRGIKEANCLSVVIVRPKTNLWLPEFFELAFNSNIVRKQIGRSTGGGVQTVVNTSEIAKSKIMIPPLREQTRIVSIISGIESYIQIQKSKGGKLNNLKKGLMQKLLTGKIRVKV